MNKRTAALTLSLVSLASPVLAERYTTQVPVTLTFDGKAYTDTIEVQWEIDDSAQPTPETALKYGDSGDAVSKLQQDLKTLGYFSGSVTGFFGSSTQNAVSALQKANGLAETGIADAQTLAKIAELLEQKNNNGEETLEEKYSSFGYIIDNKNMGIRETPSFTSNVLAVINEFTPCRVIDGFYNDGSWWWYISFSYNGRDYHGYMGYPESIYIFDDFDAMAYVAHGGKLKASDMETAGYIQVVKIPEEEYGSWRNEIANDNFYMPHCTGSIYEYIAVIDGWYRLRSGMWIKANCVKEIDSSTLYTSENQLLYHYGDQSDELISIKMQLNNLFNLYLDTNSNVFDLDFENAIRNVQKQYIDQGLSLNITGTLDTNTLKAIQSSFSSWSETPISFNPIIYNMDWFGSDGNINAVYPTHNVSLNSTATLTDLRTKRSFNIKIQSAKNHADAEPLTSKSTAILCDIYGVSNAQQLYDQNIYYRRPMLLTTADNTQFICSIYAVPHGLNTIDANDFNGQFCLHFLNSITHGSQQIDVDHQNAILEGVSILKRMRNIVISNTAP